jgi:hypothetical protein
LKVGGLASLGITWRIACGWRACVDTTRIVYH